MEKKSSTRSNVTESKLAPGMTGVEGLNREATPEEIAEDNTTKVTKLEYDEYDESGERD